MLPDVVLVRKSYEERRRRRHAKGQQQRAWKLRRLAVDAGEEDAAAEKAAAAAAAQQAHRGRGVSSLEQEQADMERFLQVGLWLVVCMNCLSVWLSIGEPVLWAVEASLAMLSSCRCPLPLPLVPNPSTNGAAVCVCRCCRSWRRIPTCVPAWRCTATLHSRQLPRRRRRGGRRPWRTQVGRA